MSLRTMLMLLVALGAAGFTAFYARNWVMAERRAALAEAPIQMEPAAAPATYVLVARRNMAPGRFLKKDDLHWQSWPKDGVADAYAVMGARAIDEFVGAVARTSIQSGEPITDTRVVHPGDRGFLAAVLDPGLRAVSVPVNATTGISGFMFPGDRVDVILTMRLRSKDEATTRFFSETLISQVRVLAIDQTIESPEKGASVAKTATLEVTPKQAEKIALALEMGALSLSLHSLARIDDEPPDAFTAKARAIGSEPTPETAERSYTLDEDVYYMRDRLTRAVPERKKVEVNVLRGSAAGKVEF